MLSLLFGLIEKMKKLLFIFLFLCVAKFQAQDQTECFSDYLAYKSNKVSLKIDYQLSQKSSANQVMMGGVRNYTFKNVTSKSLSKQLNTEIWGVRQDDKVFINSYPFSKYKGYNEIIGIGYYSYFIGPPPTSMDKKNQLKLGFIEPGQLAMYITATSVGYVLFEDGTIKYLTKSLLAKLVADNDLLKQRVEQLNNNSEVDKMFEVLDELNKKLTSTQ